MENNKKNRWIRVKPCTVEGCDCPRFSKGLCKKHWYENYRSNKKAEKKGKEVQKDKKTLYKEDSSLYEVIWGERVHRCYECNDQILYPSLFNFHHLLPKAKYPAYRHTKDNIVILCADCHSQVETFIDKCPRTKALTEEVRKWLLNG